MPGGGGIGLFYETRMKVIFGFAGLIGGAVASYLMFHLGIVDAAAQSANTHYGGSQAAPAYLNFVSVMLTAVTVVLAALAIGIGIIAAYTFREIKDEAKRTAKVAAKEVSDDALSEVKVRQMVLDLYAKAEKEREARDEWGEAPAEEER